MGFDDFQYVHKGDTLVIIESSEYKLKVAQARANYQKTLMDNTTMGTTISTTANNLTVSDTNIEELRIRLEQAKTDYRRYEQL
ncbi:MAG: biotin/lipoyl-binding protein [Bacteroidaceae bacterium]